MKLLLIEDDSSLREVLQCFLEKERYIIEIAENYKQASRKISDFDYDCILLDIMLPDGNGLTLLKELKELKKSDNVIIISAKNSLDDKVAGLELGADDYLAKPFHLAELSARIRSVLRRLQPNGGENITFGNISINTHSFVVKVDDRVIELSRKEYDILLFFVNRPERLINKGVMAENVWGDHIDEVDTFDFIYAQIKNLRKKLKEANATPELKTIYGFGYKFTLQ